MAGAPPLQPLPEWMTTTWIQVDATRSTFVTVQFPQTYYGPSLPGLTWPWAYPQTISRNGVAVSIIGGSGGLTVLPTAAMTSMTAATVIAEPTATVIIPVLTTASASSFVEPTSLVTQSIQTTQSTSGPSSSPAAPTNISSAFSSAPIYITSASNSSIASINSTVDATTSITSAAPAPSPPPNVAQRLSAGAIAGIIVGACLLLALLVALVWLFCRKRRRKSPSFTYAAVSPGYADARQARHTFSDGNPAIDSSTCRADDRRVTEAQPLVTSSQPTFEDRSVLPVAAHTSHRPASAASVPVEMGRPRRVSQGTVISTYTDRNSQGNSVRTHVSFIEGRILANRKPSNQSSDDGAGNDQSRFAEPSTGARASGSGYSNAQGSSHDDALFASPPPRPPSRTRTVPNPPLSRWDAVGMGLPHARVGAEKAPSFISHRVEKSSSLHSTAASYRSPALEDYPVATTPLLKVADESNPASSAEAGLGDSTSSNSSIQRSVSNTSAVSLMGAPAWMRGFQWLGPYLRGAPVPTSRDAEAQCQPDLRQQHSTTEVKDTSSRLLPSSARLMRQVPHYKRVTTTAAAFDRQDLQDIRDRQQSSAGPPEIPVTGATLRDNNRGDGSDAEKHLEDDSHSPLLGPEEPSDVSAPTAKAAEEPPRTSRWSRATLGQPLRHLSGLSTVSIGDTISLTESIAASARARSKPGSRTRQQNRAPTSPRGSNQQSSPTSSLSRASSKHTSSSRAQSNRANRSGSDSAHSSRRHGNSSGSSAGRASVRSNRTNVSALWSVGEDHEAIPALPQRLPLSP